MEEEVEVQTYAEWRQDDTERARRKAYADPSTGSDHLFVKALRLEAMGDDLGASVIRQQAVARVAEIRAAYPYAE